jgi:hypothetical protein
MGIPDPSSKAYKQRRGTYFYYNRAAIGPCRRAIHKECRRPETKRIVHARQQYTLLVPKRFGKASKTRKHCLRNVISKIRSPLNIQKNSFLVD